MRTHLYGAQFKPPYRNAGVFTYFQNELGYLRVKT